MTERELTQSPQDLSDPLPALKHILTCARCNGLVWRAASLDENSIVYHCADCGAAMRIVYDAATMTWTAVAVAEKA
jgi:hypothetical protein